MKTFEEFLSKYHILKNSQQKREFVIESLDKVYESENKELLEKISLFVVGDEQPNQDLPASFQINALNWLTRLAVERYQDGHEGQLDDLFYEIYTCLWKYKWLVSDLPNDVMISLEEIQEHSELMQAYYEMFEFSLSAVHKTFMLQAMRMGNVEKAKEYFALWQNSQGDEVADDCEACEVAELVNYYHFIGDDENVLAHSEKLLNGELTCAEVPHIAFASVLNSLIRLGNWQKAQELLPLAIKTISEDPELIYLMSEIIGCTVKLGLYEQAQALIAQYGEAILAFTESNPINILYYYIATAKFDSDNAEKAAQLASMFDERNGNNYYTNRLAEVMSAIQVH